MIAAPSRYPFFAALLGLLAGMASAQAPAVAWDVREVDHPVMGAITVAVPQSGFTTSVGNAKIVSAAFVSCEKGTRTIAIELANSVESDTRGGLQPLEMPRIVCNLMVNGTAVRTDVAARWNTNELGDTLARGLAPADLRRCGLLEVEQHVAMPAGSATRSQRVALTLAPTEAGLATVFAACSEGPAVEAAAGPAVAKPAIAPKRAAVAAGVRAEPGAWKAARTVTEGKTNVRAAPAINAGLVTQLHPGTPLLAQKAEGDWWRVKPTRGSAFAGYVREDRLSFR